MSRSQRPYWVDPRFHELPHRPWRKIHLDYHNSHHMTSVAKDFDPDEFGNRLADAHVSGIVLFAKDMHGYFYYPSEYGPVHPGLDHDLLGQQVEACRRRNIKVYAYYCTTWDNYLAEHHPEWLVINRDRSSFLPKFNEPPSFTALCLSNEDFVELMLSHTREFLTRYEFDGIWYDMPVPRDGECFCKNCLMTLRTANLDPFDAGVQRKHKQELVTNWMRRSYALAHHICPGIQVDQNNQTVFGLGERVPYLDNIDIEALPTAFWGYSYYPTHVRYARTFGTSVCGMTGRFQQSWADFGGLKHPNQLRMELAGIVANAAQCDIGDQLPPSGRLDPAVYATIGRCYADIERIESFLEHAAPVVEAAIIVQGRPLDPLGVLKTLATTALGESVYGAVKLLMEAHIQFDIIEADADFDRYRLVILPDKLIVDDELACRLRTYLDQHGAIIASYHALRQLEGSKSWVHIVDLEYDGESPFKPAYLKLASPLSDTLPDYEYALYSETAQWLLNTTNTGAALAYIGEPLFQRSAEHYTSHAQTPFDHLTDYVGLFAHPQFGAAAFPLFSSYYRTGYWIYRELFLHLIERVLPERLIETNAPLSTEVTVTHQVGTQHHPERWLVHVVNFSPNRRSPLHCEYLEDPIPLHAIRISLRIDDEIVKVYLAASGHQLPVSRDNGCWNVEIPRIEISEIVVFESAVRPLAI